MDKTNALETLSALSQETRLDVFRLLVRAGPRGLPAGEIAGRLGALQNTLSSHLTTLARGGLVNRQREGRVIRYNASYERMRELLMFLMEDCCGGEKAICEPVREAVAQ